MALYIYCVYIIYTGATQASHAIREISENLNIMEADFNLLPKGWAEAGAE